MHPFRLKNIAAVISQLATDFSDPESAAEPLRQFLCNTHSPVFISQPDILPHVLFAFTTQHVAAAPAGRVGQRITHMVPVRGSAVQPALGLAIAEEEQSYTLE